MKQLPIKSTLVIGLVVTSYVTFTLVAVNIGFSSRFLYAWLRSWAIAYVLVVPSLLFVAPFIRKQLKW